MSRKNDSRIGDIHVMKSRIREFLLFTRILMIMIMMIDTGFGLLYYGLQLTALLEAKNLNIWQINFLLINRMFIHLF